MASRPPAKTPSAASVSATSRSIPAGARSSWLDGYPRDAAAGDLYAMAESGVRTRWEAVARGLEKLGDGSAATLQDQAARHTADLGLTFLVAGDEEERTWPLGAMPLIIGAAQWAGIERGLVQRAELLERLAADIYGPQRVVSEGHLPAAVIAGSPHFARKMLGRSQRSGKFIHIYAADIARGPGGQWRVLQDRVRIANGVGYALENRLAMSRTVGNMLAEAHVRRLSDFFARMREGIAATCQREQPRIALLTPGRYNQTYAEQAHMARYLGLPLVEGRDLTVLDDRLYVGTIAGPKRVEAIWRWVNTNSLDPLAFDSRSQVGVADLFDAWDAGGVEMVNWPGVEVLESPAFAAFLPRLCKVLLGEAPILPNVATWWCGQTAESSTVAARLDDLALVPAFGHAVEGLSSRGPVAGRDLDEKGREALLEALWRRPMDYCGQEIVQLSTAPAIIDGRIEPRPFTIRAFVARDEKGEWHVMPGGFARLSQDPGQPNSLMGEGDLSADVWVVDDKPTAQNQGSRVAGVPPISRGGGILASQAADNLFWFGRYNERAEATVRIVRSILGSTMEGDTGPGQESPVQPALIDLLVQWGAIRPGGDSRTPAQVCARALTETSLPGGIAALMRRRQQVGLSLRERFAADFWRIVSRPMPSMNIELPQSMLASVRWMTEHFSALAGLVSENMLRSAAWRFLEIGQRLERAQVICRVARRLGTMADNSESLGALLDLCDSQIIYRSRYLASPVHAPVLDLVLLDADNPRALVYQIARIVEHLAALPSARDDNLPEPPLRAARALLGEIEAAQAEDMTSARLTAIESRLLALSDAISSRYFLQLNRDDAERRTRLL